jgi:hypothetical protein
LHLRTISGLISAVNVAKEVVMAYRLARLFGWIGILSILFLIVGALGTLIQQQADVQVPSSHGSGTVDISTITLFISFFSLLVAMIGTSSTIMLGWRADRRQTAEYKLKIEQLELQLGEARKKATDTPPSQAAH